MISVEQMATIIQNQLNEVSADLPFDFLIHASMGDYLAAEGGSQKQLPKPLINGVVQALPSSIIPLQAVKSYVATQMLTIIAPTQPNAPENGIAQVLNAVQGFVESQAGFTGSMTDDDGLNYSYIFAPQLPQVGQLSDDIGFWYIPITVSLTWQFIAGGVTSNQIEITVDDENVILLEGGFSRTRICETNNKSNSEELTSTATQQGLTLRIVVPFIRSGLGAKLVSDMLIGSLDLIYTVTYDDGLTRNASGQAPSFEMVATEIKESIAAGTVVSITATLVIASTQSSS